LAEPTEQIHSASNEFATQLHDIDEGFRTIIERGILEVQENPSSKQEYCELLLAVRHLSVSARDGLTQVQAAHDPG
jgi:hypothetical protein